MAAVTGTVSANSHYHWLGRVAASAAFARAVAALKNAWDWPVKRPLAARPVTAATAPKVTIGRMIEHGGKFRLRNGHGSGMIRLVWNRCPPNGGALRLGKTSPFVGAVRGGALPALSCQVWKWEVSVGPMLRRMSNTSGWVTLRASAGERLLRPCS